MSSTRNNYLTEKGLACPCCGVNKFNLNTLKNGMY